MDEYSRTGYAADHGTVKTTKLRFFLNGAQTTMATQHHPNTSPVPQSIALLLLCSIFAPSHGRLLCDERAASVAVEFFGTPDLSMAITVDDGEDVANETVSHCARRCRRNVECRSFTYTKETCSLHPYDSSTGPEFKHSATGMLYYESLDKDINRIEYFSGCLTDYKNGCQNGGSCKSDCSKQGYYCACPENFRGDACQFAREDEPVLVQTIEGAPSRGCAGFSFSNEHFLIIGGYKSDDVNGTDIEATSRVFKFNETTGQYEYDHYLEGLGVTQRITPMAVGDQQLLFAANNREFDDTLTTDSVVYAYVNGTFQAHQTVTTEGAWGGAFLTATTGQRYMFISNSQSGSYDVDSPIYKWYSQYNQFYFVQNVATLGAGTPVLFDVAGVVYLVVPFEYGDSAGHSAQAELWKRSDASFIYMGCFLDDNVRAMEVQFSSDNLDIETCVTYCRLRGYPYAGLQDRTKCFCGDDGYDVYGARSDGECSQTCAGNSGQYCGASYRNSVYLTEPSWSKIQTIPDATSTIAAAHFHHQGADYVVLAQYTDGSSCDRDLVLYVWNGETEELETHQRIPNDQCVMDLELFKANGRVFLIAGADRTQYSVSGESDYSVRNIVYILEGSMFVPYWSLDGRETHDWSVFQRDGEIFLAQANYRSPGDGTKNDAVLNIYQWY